MALASEMSKLAVEHKSVKDKKAPGFTVLIADTIWSRRQY